MLPVSRIACASDFLVMIDVWNRTTGGWNLKSFCAMMGGHAVSIVRLTSGLPFRSYYSGRLNDGQAKSYKMPHEELYSRRLLDD
jgi:hypothetical protein